jgi:predicted Rossmann-fold nucleotide-binding protein
MGAQVMIIKRVSVFGGSSSKPGDIDYENACKLGKYLGDAGYIVLTGGYIGTMEAVSRGVVENGGHTIGVTCDEIERWRPVGPNSWVQMWSLMSIKSIPLKPLLLVGQGWYDTMQTFIRTQNRYIPDEMNNYVTYTADVDTAIDYIKNTDI